MKIEGEKVKMEQTLRRLIAVFDESGGNRPLNRPDSAFTMASIVVDEADMPRVAGVSRKLGEIIGKRDYKYRDVQSNLDARRLYVDLMTKPRGRVRAFAFDCSGASVARAIQRDDQATQRHAHEWPADRPRATDENDSAESEKLLREVLGYAVPQIGAWASTARFHVNAYWDTRNDWPIVERAWTEAVESIQIAPRYRQMSRFLAFGGAATGTNHALARLAGVIAGDVRQFFVNHGLEIYGSLDQSGLASDADPHKNMSDSSRVMQLMRQFDSAIGDDLGDIPGGSTCMIRGYYKAFLENDRGLGNLISFGSPDGVWGIVSIQHARNWSVRQLPD